MSDLFNQCLLIQAQYCKNNNISLPKEMEKIYNEAEDEKKFEAEINLIEAEYILNDLSVKNQLTNLEMQGEK